MNFKGQHLQRRAKTARTRRESKSRGRAGSFAEPLECRRLLAGEPFGTASLDTSGTLHIYGTEQSASPPGALVNDTIRVATASTGVQVTINGSTFAFAKSDVLRVDIRAFSGLDSIELAGGTAGGLIDAGAGTDVIKVLNSIEKTDLTVLGGDGTDSMEVRPTAYSRSISFDPGPPATGIRGTQGLYYYGSSNVDRVEVDGGLLDSGLIRIAFPNALEEIYINTGNGDDIISCNAAFLTKTTLIGGEGDDTLVGGNGSQTLIGGGGDDLLVATDVGSDTVSGGTGVDVAYTDAADEWDGIERFFSTSISGRVFQDVNDNGLYDTGDRPLANQKIQIDLDHDFRFFADEPIAWTESDGNYRIPVLTPGEVSVRRISTVDFRQTVPADGAARNVTIQRGQLVLGQDFALTSPSGQVSLSGVVYDDVNVDGVRQPGEDPLSGWLVYDDANQNFQYDSFEDSAISDANGEYTLFASKARTFHVRVRERPETEYTATPPSTYGYDVAVSTQGTEGFDFGLGRGYSVAGIYFNDVGGDGHKSASDEPLPGWTIRVYTRNYDLIKTVISDSAGRYFVSELPNDTTGVILVPEAPPGWAQTVATSYGLNFNSAIPHVYDDINLGAAKVAGVGGFLYEDLNLNQQLDNGETRLGDRIVFADLDHDGRRGAFEPYDVTLADGFYRFGVPGGGTFTIVAEPVAGSRATSPPTGKKTLTLPAGTFSLRENFGFTSTAKVTGRVFDDVDQNGFATDDESPLANVVVWIDTDADGVPDANERQTTTGANGNYEFDALPAGTYRIAHVLGAGRAQTFPSSSVWNVTLEPGYLINGLDFGSYVIPLPARISGSVFLDANGNGELDPGEDASLSGFTVFGDVDSNGLYDLGEPIAVTTEDGFVLDSLAPGDYTMRLAPASGFRQTAPYRYNGVHVESGQEVSGFLFGVIPSGVPRIFDLSPVADAYVRDGASSQTNFGGTPNLYVKDASSGFARESYLRFDIQNVAELTTAKLRIFGNLASAGEKVPVALYAANDVLWSETGITWETRPTPEPALLGTATVSGTFGQWYEFDVSNYIRQRLTAGWTMVTFVLKSTAVTTPAAVFQSREAAGNRPELAISSAAIPTIEAVDILGSGWANQFIERLAGRGIGRGGFTVVSADDEPVLPWANIDQLAVHFNRPVSLTEQSLRMTGANLPAVQSFTYDWFQRVATWSFAGSLAPGRYHVELMDVVGADSPDPAVPAVVRDFSVLPADTDRNGRVNATDLVKVRNRVGRSITQPGTGPTAYDVFSDINGDATINATDLVLTRNRVGSVIPPALRQLRPVFAELTIARKTLASELL